ncbi:hypothetical protein IJ732_03490 [bacterium]|nr:hypothetical protein [bacterium]
MIKLLKNRDFINLAILIFFLIAGFIMTYAHFGNLITDNGREAFLPTVAFDKHYVMYRDIFNLYPPLSYQINGVLYKIFGENLRVLYFAGLLNTIVIISALYYIARYFLDRYFAFLIGFFTIFYCVFGSVSNGIEFIFPYAYAYVYAFSGFLVSLACFLKYLKDYDYKYLPISLFALGFSLANKFEFSLTIFIYILALIFLKPKLNITKILGAIFSFSILLILSYGYLFYQGLNFQDVITYIEFGKRFFATQSYKDFASVNSFSFLNSIITFNLKFLPFWILFLYMLKTKAINKIFFSILSSISIFSYWWFYSQTDVLIFAWLSLPIFIIILYLIYRLSKNFNKQDFIFLLTIIIFLLSVIKINFLISKNNYGYYSIPIFIMLNIIFIKNYLKNISSKINLHLFFTVFLVSVSVICGYLQSYGNSLEIKTHKIETPKGIMYADSNIAKPFGEVIDYIKTNTPKDSTVLVMQEGVMLNFLTDRPTDLMLYHLINIHIEALGEDYILNRLNQNPPNYVVIIDGRYLTPKIVDFINKNYKLETRFDKILIGKNQD